MASAKVVLYLTLLFFVKMGQCSTSVWQENRFEFVKTGGNLTLHCQDCAAARFHWYKQTLGQNLRLIATFNTNGTSSQKYNEFKNDSRFSLDKNSTCHLIITNLTTSDSATYYCATNATTNTSDLTFKNGTTVTVWQEGLNSDTSSDTTQPKCSVTLNCTAHSGFCGGEHSVHWFKVSEGYYPRIIYSHTGRTDKCERKNNTQTHTCVYTLPIKTLNLTHNGIYYCAVASNGSMVIGDRIELDYKDAAEQLDFLVLVYFLSGALAFTTVLMILLLAFLTCLISKRRCCACTDSDSSFSPPSTTNAEGEQNEEDIHYAALSYNRRSRRQAKNVETECVYSSVRQ